MPTRLPCRSRQSAADELVLLLARKNVGRPRKQTSRSRDGLIGHLIRQHARGTGHDHVRFDNRRHEAMV